MTPTPPAELTVPPLFNGPPESANGGYLAGALAQHVAADTVTVTLRTPPPLAQPMAVADLPDGGVSLRRGDTLVAEAVPSRLARLGTPAAVPFEEAEAAAKHFRGHRRHPFPTCFVCGPARGDREGLGLFPGAVDAGAGLFACSWVPGASLAEPGITQVRPEFMWAALDCPGAWTVDLESRDVVLGRITARIEATPSVGEPCVVTSLLVRQEGRKFTTCTAVYGADGRLLGDAESIWIELRPLDGLKA